MSPFASAPVIRRSARKAKPRDLEVEQAIQAMAVIIDPKAFEHTSEALDAMTANERRTIGEQRHEATVKAQKCALMYERFKPKKKATVSVVVGRTRHFRRVSV